MTGFDVLDLTDGSPVDLDTHLAGAWGTTQLVDVATGSSHPFGDDASETCIFLIDGAAEIALGDEVLEVSARTGITLIKGARTVLTAKGAVRLFVANLRA